MINSLIAEVEININGLVIGRVKSLNILQPFDSHHSFEVGIHPKDMPEKSVVVVLKELASKIIGEKILIQLKQGERTKEKKVKEVQSLLFKGIVTSVHLSKNAGSIGTIILSGVSPTALLGSGNTTRSFSRQTLKEIVTSILTPLSDTLEKTVKPRYNHTIRYVTQYEEDNFHFLQRLAEDYGEWVYYDGQKLIFGKEGRENSEVVKLRQGDNFFNMSYSLRVTPLNFKGIYYDYFTDQSHEFSSLSDQIVGLNSYAQIGLDKSEKLFSDEKIELSYQNHRELSPLKRLVKLKKREQSNKLATLTGHSSEMTIRLGGLVSITDTFTNYENKKEDVVYGTFVVTRINHCLDARGVYQCNFEAIPNDVDFAPVDYRIIAPNAEPQPAVVKHVGDKEEMGRVKVQFPWQAGSSEMTPWIRVSNLMSSKKQGVYFIPEVDEVVFVDFEFGNPDLPFVTGSMYHGSNKPEGLFRKDNTLKGIITKGGNHIIIDDTEGKEQIRIYNKESKNEILLSLDGGSHIKVKSNGSISLDAATIIKMKAPKIEMIADEEWLVKSGKTEIDTDQDMKLSAGTETAISAQTGVKIEGMNVDIESQTTATLKANAQLDIDGGAVATLKGTVVMIN